MSELTREQADLIAEHGTSPLATAPARAGSPAGGAAEPVRRWPFVESPGQFAERLRVRLEHFDGDLLAAVRNVLIEEPATLASPPRLPAGWVPLLQRLEWIGFEYNSTGEGEHCCPDCGAWQSSGHKANCELSAMLSARPHPPAPVPNSIPLQDLIAEHEKDPVKAAALAVARRRLAEGEPKAPLIEAIERARSAAFSAVHYVGAANYASREREAITSVNEAFENLLRFVQEGGIKPVAGEGEQG